jgi:hypothetical protein
LNICSIFNQLTKTYFDMRSSIKISSILLLILIAVACKKSAQTAKDETVSQSVLDRIYAMGFSNKNVQLVDDGYLVEGDIYLSANDLAGSASDIKLLRVGTEEQYRTTNLVSGLPRTITVSISSRLPSSYVAALDQALARYNALGLRITFQRVSSGAAISLTRASGNYLASSGLPSGGNPYNSVKVNSNAIGSQPQATVASIIAHELGHCIGFRHTDYMNRAYSCGGQPVNEGASTVGAIQIPGTPSGPDPNSWMLSCIGSGQDRPFNTNDRTALNYLYH